jgi:hypothetical protein
MAPNFISIINRNTEDFNKMQKNVLPALKQLVEKTIVKITSEDSERIWDKTFHIHFDDGTKLTFGQDSYDPLQMKIDDEPIY